jgi:hypothetical protein
MLKLRNDNSIVKRIFMSDIVDNVFKKGFLKVRENDTLSYCIELFKKENPPVLAVLDDKGHLQRSYFSQMDNTV